MQRTMHQQGITVVLACVVGVALWFSGDSGRWLLAMLGLMIVPGWWWQRMFPLPHVHWLGRWMMQAVIGPSLVVIAYLWAAWAQVQLPVGWMWVGIAGLGLLMCWRIHSLPRKHIDLIWGVTALCVVLLIVMTRWVHIDGLVLPPWVDGVHHALLVRVAIEQSHAATNLLPYLPVERLLYHTGWHSIMAFVWQITPTSSMIQLGRFLLVVGQWWNILAVVSVAGMVWYWWRSWPATVIALIVVGLWSIMPAYYLSWGRYTLLAGMAWLPIALMTIDVWWSADDASVWPWVMVIIAGLLLTHFVIGIMVVIWGVVVWVGVGRLAQQWPMVVVGILLCMLPWWVMFLVDVQWMHTGDASARVVPGNLNHNAFVPGLFWARYHIWLVPLTLVSAWWLIRRRQVRVAWVVLWWSLVIGLANPVVIGLPYLSFFTNETWTTALYLPMAVVIARLGANWYQRWVSVLLVVVALAGFGGMQYVVRQATVLTNDADMSAISWIDEHLSADAVIVTNATEWMWRVDRGVDGGWWVMPLTGRSTTTPPVLYTYADASVAQALYDQTEHIRQVRSATALDKWLQANPAITHIYATSRGSVTPALVDQLPYVRNVYATGDVAIYAVQP